MLYANYTRERKEEREGEENKKKSTNFLLQILVLFEFLKVCLAGAQLEKDNDIFLKQSNVTRSTS